MHCRTSKRCALREFFHWYHQYLISESGWYFILMEYCDMGNLLNYQSKLPNKIFNLYEATKIMTEILDGIETVHKKSIIHRDIKLENIFLKKNKMGGFNCKIGDFGFAK